MLSNIPSALKSALPLALMASPLLLAAAQPPSSEADLDRYGVYCDTEAAQQGPLSTRANNAQTSGTNRARPISAPHHVVVTSEREMSAFARSRVGTALRLLRANPYNNATHAVTGTATDTGSAAVSARDNCIAVVPETEPEVLIALSVTDEQLLSQPLPDLSNPGLSMPAPTTPAPRPVQAVPQPPSTPQPAVTPTARPTTRPATQPAASPPAPQPTAPTVNQAPSGFSAESQRPSLDPFNYTPTTVEPTPFDGSKIQTLSALADGNYRYISGTAEDRIYSDAELRDRGSAIFVLKKEGNVITGNLSARIGLAPVCVTGGVSGDLITGAAYPTDTTKASDVGDRYEPYGSISALQVRRTRKTEAGLYYAGALLDLSNFSMINAGSALPPESCSVGSI